MQLCYKNKIFSKKVFFLLKAIFLCSYYVEKFVFKRNKELYPPHHAAFTNVKKFIRIGIHITELIFNGESSKPIFPFDNSRV